MTDTAETKTASSSPEPYIRDPLDEHTHTAILLHDLGADSGLEFATRWFPASMSGARVEGLPLRLPGWRWVLPSALSSTTLSLSTLLPPLSPSKRELPLRNIAVVEDRDRDRDDLIEVPAWFETSSDSLTSADATAKKDLGLQQQQMNGLRESVEYVLGILDKEIARLHGRAENVVLGGIGQGAAVALWTLLCLPPRLSLVTGASSGRIGGFVGHGCWLPFAEEVEGFFDLGEKGEEGSGSKVLEFVESRLADTKTSLLQYDRGGGDAAAHPLLSTPVFLGHGVDDTHVDVRLGRKASDVLKNIGFRTVQLKVYAGAAEGGHWLKEPKEMDDIANFLEAVYREAGGEGGKE